MAALILFLAFFSVNLLSDTIILIISAFTLYAASCSEYQLMVNKLTQFLVNRLSDDDWQQHYVVQCYHTMYSGR